LLSPTVAMNCGFHDRMSFATPASPALFQP
jgi:hypothetical protein